MIHLGIPPIVQQFEWQAKCHANDIAVIWNNQQYTFQEINERANQLAHRLQGVGVGPEKIVGIYLDRSVESIIAQLGVLKSGGAYLPIDEFVPSKRLAFMLEDAKPFAFITKHALVENLPWNVSNIVHLDLMDAELNAFPTSNPHTNIEMNHLAYVIYTSGSTGRPKGVLITHLALTNLLYSFKNMNILSKNDSWLAVTTFVFDISGLEIYLPLLSGSRIVLASHDVVSDPKRLIEMFYTHKITVMQATPTTWQMLLNYGWKGHKELEILCGGEALSRKLANQLLECCHSLWNMYGPTETTIWSMMSIISNDNEAITLGQGIANTDIYLLDESDHVIDTEGQGELAIGGMGLARGYLNRPDLTQERFIDISVDNKKKERIYKTGDIVKRTKNGDLLFIGRKDFQVKIRGYRIETSEIAAVLENHTEVRNAAVKVIEDVKGDKRIVAYIIPDSAPSEQSLKWGEVWNDVYRGVDKTVDEGFDIRGWNDSYTGLPLRPLEIRDWIDCTAQRILALKPKRLLEQGCGTGLLFFRLAEHCQTFVGCDIANEGIASIRRQMQKMGKQWNHVQLDVRPADDISNLQEKYFDTVVINSVIQYFPDASYLLKVIENLVSLVESGANIFLGDIRNLTLLEAFHTSVCLFKATGNSQIKNLNQSIKQRLSEESALVLDPQFFYLLPKLFPRIRSVEIQLKRGVYQNELNRFRYDVILHVADEGTEKKSHGKCCFLNWSEIKNLDNLKKALADHPQELCYVQDIPNLRIIKDLQAVEHLKHTSPKQLLVDFKKQLSDLSNQGAISPEELWQLESSLPYLVKISWSRSNKQECFDALFIPNNIDNKEIELSALFYPQGQPQEITHAYLQQYVNQPTSVQSKSNLLFNLRKYLRDFLPDYMMPANFVFLDTFPMTVSGKIDLNALPAPEHKRPDLEQPYVSPRNSIEEKLTSLWGELLEINGVGINDNLFELGGHSLLLTQIMALVFESYKVQLSLAEFFNQPTIATMAEMIQTELDHRDNVNTTDTDFTNMLSDNLLDASIAPIKNFSTTKSAKSEIKRVLLTGSTGFIGAFILYEMLKNHSWQVTCLVRSSNDADGLLRVKHNLQRFNLWCEEFASRITIIPGDLSIPLFGLTYREFSQLAHDMDCIYHSGASVNLVYPYSMMRKTNVIGLQEVLRLACEKTGTPLHYISSLAVFESRAYRNLQNIPEILPGDQIEGFTGGYAQSKWVAEKLIAQAKSRGLPVTIYRPGMVSGCTYGRALYDGDLIDSMIQAFIYLKQAPILDYSLDMTPVDYVAKSMVALSQINEENGPAPRIYHLLNPRPMPFKDFIAEIRSWGHPIKLVSYEEWREDLLERALRHEEHPLTPILSLFVDKLPGIGLTYIELSSMLTQTFDCSHALALLKRAGMTCPPFDSHLLAQSHKQ